MEILNQRSPQKGDKTEVEQKNKKVIFLYVHIILY